MTQSHNNRAVKRLAPGQGRQTARTTYCHGRAGIWQWRAARLGSVEHGQKNETSQRAHHARAWRRGARSCRRGRRARTEGRCVSAGAPSARTAANSGRPCLSLPAFFNDVPGAVPIRVSRPGRSAPMPFMARSGGSGERAGHRSQDALLVGEVIGKAAFNPAPHARCVGLPIEICRLSGTIPIRR